MKEQKLNYLLAKRKGRPCFVRIVEGQYKGFVYVSSEVQSKIRRLRIKHNVRLQRRNSVLAMQQRVLINQCPSQSHLSKVLKDKPREDRAKSKCI